MNVQRVAPPRVGEHNTDRTIDHLTASIRALQESDLAGAKVIETGLLTAGAVNKIAHGMGRRPVIVSMILRARGAGPLTDDRDTNPHDDRFLYIYLSGVTASRATLVVK